MALCSVCECQSTIFTEISGYKYYECSGCGIIAIENSVLDDIDNGSQLVEYKSDYWQREAQAADERSRAEGILRLAEAIYLTQRPVDHVLDVGTGTGKLLDYIKPVLCTNSSRVWGVELFPPPIDERSRSSQYVTGLISDLQPKMFESGLCMEVIEHMTPKMVRELFRQLSLVSSPNACYYFNTALAFFVKNVDISYLDPTIRGHIVSWTVDGINHLCKEYGLTASVFPGRSWGFLVEKTLSPVPFIERLHNPISENLNFLSDNKGSRSLLGVASAESIRGYYYYYLASGPIC